MINDIRLPVGFFTHPKTVRLLRQAGAGGLLCLQRLWLWAAQNKADGNLSGFNDEDLEIIAGWTGEPGAFVRAIAGLRFLDGQAGLYRLHDWAEHQAYAAEAPKRVAQAKKAAKKRWDNADGIADSNADGNAPGNAPNRTDPNRLLSTPDGVLAGGTPPAPPPGPARQGLNPENSVPENSVPEQPCPGAPALETPAPGGPETPAPEGDPASPALPEIPGTPAGPGSPAAAAFPGSPAAPEALSSPVSLDSPDIPASPATEACPASPASPAFPPAPCPPCPHGRIVALYHEALPELARVKSWAGSRQKHLQARWRERWKAGKYRTQAEGLDYWKRLFEHIGVHCDFLVGRVPGVNGRPSFRADLGWLVKPENFARLIEGRYDRRDA